MKKLIEWGFRDARCRAITAQTRASGTGASHRVLEKVGMRVYDESEEALDWRVDKADSRWP